MDDLHEVTHLMYFFLVAIESGKMYGWLAAALFILGGVSYCIHKYRVHNKHSKREDK